MADMASDDEYEKVSKGKLNLKINCDIKKKKKKKKDKVKEKIEKTVSNLEEIAQEVKKVPVGRPLTKAEKTFKDMQEKMQKKRILEKASMTHKQRVEKFNQHLDSLTEHFDIPKVSWTK